MPFFLPEFVNTYPMIDIRLSQAFSDILAESVLTEAVEFAVVLEPPKHEGIEITKLSEGSMVLSKRSFETSKAAVFSLFSSYGNAVAPLIWPFPKLSALRMS